ncbi:MAG: polyribonucleotide nucleotidyltransferase [Patescibacteria group bacterium]
MKSKKFTTEVGGRTLTAEFTNWAEHANGSCLVTYGETSVLATAVQSKSAREGIDFFPLTVDYEEKFYAAGKILGSRFMRREGKASDEAILVSRLIDRSIRPLFSQKIRNEVQVIVLALSIDENNDPDICSIIAASLALGTSDIRWAGPVGSVRIGKIDDKFIINPTYTERESILLDTVICGKDGKINMIEAGAQELSEDDMEKALELAVKEIDKLCNFQNKIIDELGKAKKEVELAEASHEMKIEFANMMHKKVEESIYIKEKTQRYEMLNALRREWAAISAEQFPHIHKTIADGLFEEAVDEIVHKNIIDPPAGKEKRPDGRGIKELRRIAAKVQVLPRIHGSGLFYRGETHVLSAATLGAPSDVQLIEGMEVRAKKRFMHHYNFPPFSVGEIKPMRGPGRRDIGHGALAERALVAIIPDVTEFPYTIRVVSETLSSNGSSSMGSVCGSTLALMDAGVPIKAPVAGIAMGLMLASPGETSDVKSPTTSDVEEEKVLPKYKILTDIQGPEDHHGDMDFKVAGTKNGITAVQMDVKVDGIPLKIMKEAFLQAREARLEILEIMLKELPGPRKELSSLAPRIITMRINPDKIRDVIGPGGKVINELIALTGAQIDIEQDGTIFITGPKEENAKKAEEEILALTKEFEVGEIIKGKVTRLFPFGAMVEVAPKQEGLVHISALSNFRVEQITDVVSPGDVIEVQIIEIDDQGRINLSAKAVRPLELKSPEARAKGAESLREQENHRNRNGNHRNRR